MDTYGATSDIIVAAMLAIGQLITPVPDAGIKAGEQAAIERQSCAAFNAAKSSYKAKSCEDLKENDRRKFKKECQTLETNMNLNEVQCASDPEIPKVLRFKPRPLAEYMNMSNADLVEELHTICYAAQDRIFLDAEQWMSGVTANRDDLGSKLSILQNPAMDTMFQNILQEASEGNFKAGDAFNTIAALCHWSIDRKEVARKIDFRGGLKYLQELINELPRVDRLPELPEASFVYDKHDHRIGEIFNRTMILRNGKQYVGGLSRRRNVKPTDVPKMLMNAFISIEDKRFRQHNGFDFEALKRLSTVGAQGGSTQGGSTFTMQLIKNAWFTDDVERERTVKKRTIRRKIKEMLMIPIVERTYSKDEILTYYLNLISLTANAQGIKMAAMDLFNKENLNDLTLGEMATLAALPKGTTAYNPWRYPVAAKARRNLVLDAMFEQNDQRPRSEQISEMEREAEKAKDLGVADPASLEKARIFSQFFTGHLNNYFRAMKSQNIRDPRWKKGGFDIKTSFDLDLQMSVTKSLQAGLRRYEQNAGRYKWTPWIDSSTEKNMNVAVKMTKPGVEVDDVFESLRLAHPYPEADWVIGIKTPKTASWLIEGNTRATVEGRDSNVFRTLKDYDVVLLEKQEDSGRYFLVGPTKVQGAVVVLDSETGEVLAMSGGFSAGAYGKLGQNNRATRSMRQPGSSIKPMTYLYALNHGMQPNVLLRNSSVQFPKIENCPYKWAPKNYRGEGGSSVIVRNALEHSMNRPLVNMFLQVSGVPNSLIANGQVADLDPENRDKLRDTLFGIYDLAVDFGAYSSRQSLAERRRQQPCFPFLLGGFETTPLNMAQMYAAISNGGLKRDAIFLRQVFKDKQPLLVDHTQEKREQVNQYREAIKQGFNLAPAAFGAIPGITPASVAQLRSLMQGVLRRGTAQRIKQWANLIGGKTGTTNDSQDAWFSGYTKKMAVIVWVGYDDKKDYDNLGSSATGGGTALPIFESIMTDYYKAHPEELNNPLPLPDEIPGVVNAKIDMGSGRVYSAGEQSSCKSSAPSSAIDEFLLSSVVKVSDQRRACEVSKLN